MPPEHTPIADTMAVPAQAQAARQNPRHRRVATCPLAELEENLRCGAVASDQFRY